VAIRLLLMTQWFDPEPTTKGLSFARELAQRGFDVEVVTGFPNYPGGKVYPGYRIRWLHRECIDGVRVVRVPLFPSHDKSVIRRVLNYLSFTVCATLYGVLGAARPGVVYAYHPPITVALGAAIVRLLRRSRLVIDVQDLWPDSLSATGMVRNRLVLWMVSVLCKAAYLSAHRIVALSPGMRDLIISRGVPESKLAVIYNWADEEALGGRENHRRPGNLPDAGKFIVLFAGNMGPAQALEAVIDTAALVEKSLPNVGFVFLGTGISLEALKAKSRHLGLNNVTFLPPVSVKAVRPYLQAADALLVHLRNEELFRVTVPSKTQAYLAVGRPIVMAVPGDCADLISKSKSGVLASSEDAKSISQAIESLVRMPKEARDAMGVRGNEFYEQQLSLERGVSSFAALLREVIDHSN
jgi:colanic acid biosynthesis glycosyl transferase WcaI